MWKKSQSTSNPNHDFDQCKTCLSSYPSCTTCSKYGRVKHVHDKKKEAGCHDNSGFINHEKNDPRSKK